MNKTTRHGAAASMAVTMAPRMVAAPRDNAMMMASSASMGNMPLNGTVGFVPHSSGKISRKKHSTTSSNNKGIGLRGGTRAAHGMGGWAESAHTLMPLSPTSEVRFETTSKMGLVAANFNGEMQGVFNFIAFYLRLAGAWEFITACMYMNHCSNIRRHDSARVL